MKNLSLEERLFLSHIGGYENMDNYKRSNTFSWFIFVVNVVVVLGITWLLLYFTYAMFKYLGVL